MPFIIECDNCGYSRSSDQDGQMFHQVCGICYDDKCLTPATEVELCNECYEAEHTEPVIDPGESLLT